MKKIGSAALRLPIALLLVASPASGAVAAECLESVPQCAAGLPSECIQEIGVETPDGARCDSSLADYLVCVDSIITACAADSEAQCREVREVSLWRTVRGSSIPEDLDFFLRTCPESEFRGFAEARIEAFGRRTSATEDPAPLSAELAETEMAALRARQVWLEAEVVKHTAGLKAIEIELQELLARAELARRKHARVRGSAVAGATPSHELAAAESAAAALEARYEIFVKRFALEQADQKIYEDETSFLFRDIARIERQQQ